MKIKYPEQSNCVAYGRNGTMKCVGLDIYQNDFNPDNRRIELAPINSKGLVGKCSIEIPLSCVAALANTLKQIIGTTQELIDTYGHWGEHDFHDRKEWRRAVAADETQLGYWEWVERMIGMLENNEETDDE